MCRGEWGTEVDSGHVWRHGGVPDIGVVLIGNPDPCLSCSFGARGGLEQQGRSHSFADKQGLENTGEGRSALDCASVLVLSSVSLHRKGTVFGKTTLTSDTSCKLGDTQGHPSPVTNLLQLGGSRRLPQT